MPLYEYRCKQCDKVFEVIQKFSDPALTVHEECGGEVERLISAPGLHFKGSGWYITDYARAGGKSGADKPVAGAGKSEDSKSGGSSSSSNSSSTPSSTPAASTSGDRGSGKS